MRHAFFRFLLGVGFAVGVATPQSNVASVTGIVTDPTGAAVPQAKVSFLSLETGIETAVLTNEAGVYLAPSLLAGKYRVVVSAQGFKQKEIRNLTLGTAERLRLDIALELGELTERVDVEATVTPLMQESAEISETITAAEIRNIPLKTRSPYGLLVLTPGVSSTSNDPSEFIDTDVSASIAGTRHRGNTFIVDGASTTHIGGIPERIGSIEAIHEFKVLSTPYSAEYGRTAGAVVSFQVKSGTLEYHGSLYQYHRNNALNANNWQNNANNVKPSALIRNEFGGTLGGPVPGFHKRMFFFASYEGLRDRIPVNRLRTIPDPSVRTGNFSGLPVPVYDPDLRSPFPGNIIPASRLDPAALKFLQLFPQPNVQGVYNARYGIWSNNWLRAASQSDGKNFGILRLDHNPSDRDKLFATFSQINEGPRDLVKDFDSVLNTTVGPRFRNIRRLTIGYTRFLRNDLTHEFLAFAQRDPRKIDPWFPSFDVTRELGIQRKVGTGLPTVSISGGFGNYGNSDYQNWVHQPAGLSSGWTWVRGKHNIKYGAQLYQNQFWYISATNLSGTYSFSGDVTGLGTGGLDNPVNALADFLLGAVKTATIQVPQIPINRLNWNLGLYLNDDWKATQRLTVNLGLRYEFETKQIVKNNVYSRVDLATGELLVAGRNASRNLNVYNDYLNLSPRLGLAYSLNPKTVVRAGAGVFHMNVWIHNGEMVRYPGWTTSVSFVSLGLGRAQPFRFTEGFPVDRVPSTADPLALAAAATVQSPLSVAAVTYNPRDRMPYTVQWSLSLQRDVGFHTTVDVAYVATRGVKLAWSVPANNPPLEMAPAVVIQRVPPQQVRPLPRYTAFNAVFYQGRSDYHSLQAKATRRFSQGLSIDANYTFSKMLDTNSGVADTFQIPWQFANIERAVSSLDRTHILNFGWVYELPLGKGRRWASGGKFWSALLGGFQVNGVFSAASGVPQTITQTTTNTILSNQRPDVINAANLAGRLSEPHFVGPARRWLIAPGDPQFPFQKSSNIGIGNLGRNTSREPGFWNLSLSVFRQFKLSERWALELRGEAFNALNTVNFLEPAANIDSATYGLSTSAAAARQIQVGARIVF